MKISALSKSQFDRLPLQMNKNPNINCSNELRKHFYTIFNEDNISALNHFAEKENANIYFTYLPDDMFNNTIMTVFKKHELTSKEAALNINTETKDDFVNSLRSIYTKPADLIKQLAKE